MCKLCKIKPVYEFTNKRKVCSGCFIRYFQKKFLYIIRKFKMIKKDDVVGYVSGGCFRGVVLEYLLKMFAEKAYVRLIKLKGSPSNLPAIPKSVRKLAVSNNVDVVSKKIVDVLTGANISNLRLRPVEGKIIRPLYLFTDKEILLYAKLKNLKFNKIKQEKESVLDVLEKKHPEIKRAIVQSYLKIS